MTSMRLKCGVDVAGVEPELARKIARVHHSQWLEPVYAAGFVEMEEGQLIELLECLREGGLLKRREDAHFGVQYKTSTAGNALAMASFQRPISRTKAEALLQGVVERATHYNSDARHPFVVARLAVFGSYLDPSAKSLGDLDLWLVLHRRSAEWTDPQKNLEYARQSGRTFRRFIDALGWPECEVKQILRNRSGYIKLHDENVGELTDRWEVVYQPESQILAGSIPWGEAG